MMGCCGMRPATFDRALEALKIVLQLSSFAVITHFILSDKGPHLIDVRKISDFWIPLVAVKLTQLISILVCFLGTVFPAYSDTLGTRQKVSV